MTNLGFSWNFEPKFDDNNDVEFTVKSSKCVVKNVSKKPKRKWRSDDDQQFIPSRALMKRHGLKPVNSNKKARNFTTVTGSQLPIFRSIELLDKKQLSTMVMKLIDEKPELNQIIYNNLDNKFDSLINPSVDKSMKYLEECLTEKVLQKLPYKVEPESEYSFLRVQKNLVEFYSTLSDFIKNYLPPRESNFIVCLRFVDFATSLVHKIPKFKINSYNLYHYTKIYHELSDAWWSIFKFFLVVDSNESLTSSESDINVFHMVEFNLIERVEQHQKFSKCEEFDRIVEFVNNKISDYHLNNIDLANGTSLVNDLFIESSYRYKEGFNLNISDDNETEGSVKGSSNFTGNNNPLSNSLNAAILDGTMR